MSNDMLACLSRLRRKPRDEATMFPGIRLTYKVQKSQFAAQIVGDAFEKVSHVILGDKWRRLFPESDMDVRPDLGSLDHRNFVESKASKDRRYYKVAAQQLGKYKNLIDLTAASGVNLTLCYFMWSYCADASLSGGKHTLGDVLKTILSGVVQLDIIDWRIMFAIYEKTLEKKLKNTQYREYTSWRNNAGKPGYCALQISHPFMRRLRENPHNVLNEELGLKATDYDLRTNHKKRTAKVEFDGVVFKTAKFQINRYVAVPKLVPDELPETFEPVWSSAPDIVFDTPQPSAFGVDEVAPF